MNYLRVMNFLFLNVCHGCALEGGGVLGDSHLVSAIHQREGYDLILLFHSGLVLCCLYLFAMSNFFQAKESRVMVVLILFLVVRYYKLIQKFTSIINLACLDQVDEMALEIVERV